MRISPSRPFHSLVSNWLLALCMCSVLTGNVHALPQTDLITGYHANGAAILQKSYVLSEQELELIQRIAQHPLQQRPVIVLDPALTLYAKAKSDDLANRSYFAHSDPQGNLITYYFGDAPGFLSQTFENLAAGYTNAAAAVDAWERSTTGHRESLFGLPRDGVANPLYPYFGVGHTRTQNASDPYGGHYWTTQNAWNPAAHPGPIGNTAAIAQASKYQLFLPDGVTPVDRNWNWVTSEIAGMQRVHVNGDGSYQRNGMGRFRNLGGMFFRSDAMGITYSLPDHATGVHHYFTSKQGWLWTTPQLAPHYWSKQRGNWIYVDTHGNRVFDYNNQIWEDWTPDGQYARILSDKRQTYVGQPVVIAWDADRKSPIVEFWSSQSNPDGLPTHYSNAPMGAILWHPPAPGSYVFAVRSKAVPGPASAPGQQIHAENVRIDVIPHPDSYSNAAVQIWASNSEVALGSPFSIRWNSTGGIPIVRSSPGQSPANVDGVFSNEPSGEVSFVKRVPGIYRYSIQMGSLMQEVVVRVLGTKTAPPAPR